MLHDFIYKANMKFLQFSIFTGTWPMDDCICCTLCILFNTEIGKPEQSWEPMKFRALILGMSVNFEMNYTMDW
jgi:hypothetical protein